MMKVEIEFLTLGAMWEFWHLYHSHMISLSIRKNTLTCECTEAEVELATNAFGATVKEVV